MLMYFARAAFNNSIMFQNRFNCSEETFDVHCKALAVASIQLFDIFAVEFGFYGNFQFIASVDLRPTGKSCLLYTSYVSQYFIANIVDSSAYHFNLWT